MKKIFLRIVVLLFTGTSYGSDAGNNLPAPSRYASSPFTCLHSAWVDSVYNSLTPDERIAQLFFAPAYSNLGEKHVNTISGYIEKYKIGGLIFFQGGPKRQALLTNRYQKLSQTPLLIAMDAEWGLGMRLDSCISFPRQMALGAIQDMNLISRMGGEIGLQCRRMGIHLNFAPVVDINSNPRNPVINVRSFGENSHEVAQRSVMYMTGMQRQGVLTAAKHFPGHGNTSVDSHYELPVVAESCSSLDSLEWHPYKELFKHRITGVLAAHVNVPALDSTPDLAASLSRRVLTDILRDSLGFDGLIFTDALNMKSVSKYFKPGELEVKALEAGADVLLMPADIPKAIKSIRNAIAEGRISPERIEQSCRKILASKEWVGLNSYHPTDTAKLLSCLNSPGAGLLNRMLVEASLTVVQNREQILPFKQLDKEKTAILITGLSSPNNFLRTLGLYEENDYFFFDKNTSATEEKALFETLSKYSRVIVGIHNTSSSPGRNFGILTKAASLADRLTKTTNVILCLFAPPYALSTFQEKENMAAIVVSYQETPLAQDYTAQLLYGAIAGTGKLPVSVDSVYRYGQGVDTEGKLRLKYSVPEEVNILPSRLYAVDSLIRNAIAEDMLPGCQILAARNGVVFFNREYGRTRTDSQGEPVHPRHIYDLASVTKIGAATPAIMLLYDQDRIKLRDRLGEYLPFLEDSNKERITLLDLMTHQARFQPFIGFYLSTMEPLDSGKRMLSQRPDTLYSIYLGPGSYLNNRTRFKDSYYASSENGLHQLQVANGMYVVSSYRDTVFYGIRDSRLLSKKQYRYSDLGFILLTDLVERVSGWPLDEFVAANFYKPLGATSLGYRPLKHFPEGRVVPTANDTVFRHQWLQGHVHDENAALMGGVSGHAGLFGNANDLAKLMQMYMNGGVYGGERYIEEKTVEQFTSSPFHRSGNRRGIGFDKPEPLPNSQNPISRMASRKSFGHTGFTGTYTWADPENGLLYIFLSNRVCPYPTNNKMITTNLRTKIYEVFVRAIDD